MRSDTQNPVGITKIPSLRAGFAPTTPRSRSKRAGYYATHTAVMKSEIYKMSKLEHMSIIYCKRYEEEVIETNKIVKQTYKHLFFYETILLKMSIVTWLFVV